MDHHIGLFVLFGFGNVMQGYRNGGSMERIIRMGRLAKRSMEKRKDETKSEEITQLRNGLCVGNAM